MQILKEENLFETGELLSQGKVVVLPSETAYGLSCDARQQSAVDKIFKIKGRPSDKPLLIVVPSIEMAKKYLLWNERIDNLAERYWPGPLTIVGEPKPDSGLAKGIISTNQTLAVRVTNYHILRYLAEKINAPLVSTSANLSGGENIYSAAEAESIFKNQEHQPEAIFDNGVLEENLPTTIVSILGGEMKILRQGEIKI